MDNTFATEDDKRVTALMAIDLSSAFCCVSPEILLRKLEIYKFGPEVQQWIQSYLEFRSTYIQVGTESSSMRAQVRGLPQGSVLSPLLYLIYTNELSEIIKDTNCEDEAQDDLEELFGNNCESCGKMTCFADDRTYSIAAK